MDRFVERLVGEVLEKYGSDKTRLMDMLWEVQRARGHISEDAIAALAKGLNMSVPDVGETVTFYHFFRTKPFAQHVIYLADTVIARMNGYDDVRAALIEATGADFGVHDSTGQFGLDVGSDASNRFEDGLAVHGASGSRCRLSATVVRNVASASISSRPSNWYFERRVASTSNPTSGPFS